ncbi:VOC family protein [Cellulomonas cellasea]|nr:VOC family protein [Cellulomonas cellasea]
MGSNRSMPESAVVPVLTYPDVPAAVAWLSATFGLVERLRIGEHRAQLRCGEGDVIAANGGGERREPGAGAVSHSIMVRVEDVDAHCERARSHGAQVLLEPTDHPYGERQYTVEDLAGHQWTFTQTTADVAPEEWGGELVDA